MTRYGVLADPHGNQQALLACLALLEAEGVDRLVCLGDLVGYQAGANQCTRLLFDAGALAIAGNHDLIALGALGFDQCADKVSHALRRTRRDLSAWSRAYLRTLPPRRLLEGSILAVHGGLDEVQHYLRTPADLQATAAGLADRFPAVRLLLFAHTHQPCLFELQSGRLRQREVEAGAELQLDRGRLSLLNPGSVDASRKRVDGEARVRHAELCLLDSERWRVRFLRVPYHHAASEAAARAGGYRIGAAATRLYRWRRRLGELGAAARRRLALGPG